MSKKNWAALEAVPNGQVGVMSKKKFGPAGDHLCGTGIKKIDLAKLCLKKNSAPPKFV